LLLFREQGRGQRGETDVKLKAQYRLHHKTRAVKLTELPVEQNELGIAGTDPSNAQKLMPLKNIGSG